jgi:hypothetical protein
MGRLDSELEDLYRRRQGAFQVMLASVMGSVESAREAKPLVRSSERVNDAGGGIARR